jgi:murein DD-endopeptidase MepM/ murein hydrolase activator NlpD
VSLAAERELDLTHRERALQPGEVVWVEVRAPVPLDRVTASLLGTSVTLAPGDARTYEGLLGLDLDAKPGPHALDVRARAGARTLTASATLHVEAKQFRTRQLTVEPRFVEPPPEVQARIAREGRRVSAILAGSSASRRWRGHWVRPVPGQALSSFGVRSVFNGQPRNPHTGTDFRAATGTRVRAPAAGLVALAEEHYFSGGLVILDHGLGVFSLFAHLSAFGVREGDEVERGQELGRAGATGRVTGPHLHWALRVAGTRVDAQSVLHVLGGSEAG